MPVAWAEPGWVARNRGRGPCTCRAEPGSLRYMTGATLDTPTLAPPALRLARGALTALRRVVDLTLILLLALMVGIVFAQAVAR